MFESSTKKNTNIEKDFAHFPPSKYKKLQDKLTSECYTATLDELQHRHVQNTKNKNAKVKYRTLIFHVSGKYDK